MSDASSVRAPNTVRSLARRFRTAPATCQRILTSHAARSLSLAPVSPPACRRPCQAHVMRPPSVLYPPFVAVVGCLSDSRDILAYGYSRRFELGPN
ncbi:hypothetical protein GWI33_011958 [Rhynchophorus ferrugineus]|uniref:Uncharacterized protein n=1 Tax=Rhynchophorus ferrugineus TaxID=354439 RepID=A0A834IQ09_RHYFE|nr:hypothetical protein GWI33_011958 [Rhynchophorus ferrugineus]